MFLSRQLFYKCHVSSKWQKGSIWAGLLPLWLLRQEEMLLLYVYQSLDRVCIWDICSLRSWPLQALSLSKCSHGLTSCAALSAIILIANNDSTGFTAVNLLFVHLKCVNLWGPQRVPASKEIWFLKCPLLWCTFFHLLICLCSHPWIILSSQLCEGKLQPIFSSYVQQA